MTRSRRRSATSAQAHRRATRRRRAVDRPSARRRRTRRASRPTHEARSEQAEAAERRSPRRSEAAKPRHRRRCHARARSRRTSTSRRNGDRRRQGATNPAATTARRRRSTTTSRGAGGGANAPGVGTATTATGGGNVATVPSTAGAAPSRRTARRRHDAVAQPPPPPPPTPRRRRRRAAASRRRRRHDERCAAPKHRAAPEADRREDSAEATPEQRDAAAPAEGLDAACVGEERAQPRRSRSSRKGDCSARGEASRVERLEPRARLLRAARRDDRALKTCHGVHRAERDADAERSGKARAQKRVNADETEAVADAVEATQRQLASQRSERARSAARSAWCGGGCAASRRRLRRPEHAAGRRPRDADATARRRPSPSTRRRGASRVVRRSAAIALAAPRARDRGRSRAPSSRRSTTSRAQSPSSTRGPPSCAIARERRARRAARSCTRDVTGHGVTRTRVDDRHRPAPHAERVREREARRRSPAVVHVLPTAKHDAARRWREPAATCSASSNAADSAPSVPIGVAPPGGITIESRRARCEPLRELRPAIPRGDGEPANGTSTTLRSRTIGQPDRDQRAAFSIAHSLAGCGNTIAPASSPSARAWITVAIAWFEPYAPIAQIRSAPRARA